MSGIEVAGLVLAVLPLFIEAGKAYSDGVDTILNVSLRSRRDENLSDFYDEFYWEIGQLGLHIEDISSAVFDSPTAKQQPSSVLKLSEWSQDSKVELRLKAYLRSESAFNMFIVVAQRIAQLLSQLLNDEPTYVEESHLDERAMFSKLKEFASDREADETKSSFMERFKFFKKEKHRKKCMQRLHTWNKRLDSLTQRARDQARTVATLPDTRGTGNGPKNTLIYGLRSPSAQVRVLTSELYTVLSKCWKCTRSGVHEARFCLNIHGAEKTVIDAAAEFDFMVSDPSCKNDTQRWQEGTVSLISASQHQNKDYTKLDRICDALKLCNEAKDSRILLRMEDINGQQSLWKLDPKPRRIRFLETESPASLLDLLNGSAKMGPQEKRQLALICAYSLLLLHDSHWFSKGWDKSSLTFFYKLDNEPDYVRPYISTRFEIPDRKGGERGTEIFQIPAREVGERGTGVFHRNSNILTLGVLLIEIFNEKPIEKWRTEQEKAAVTPKTEANTNLTVANRVVKKMEDAPSRSAIKACLELNWVPEDRQVDLKDVEIREGLYVNVIQPLESEISWIT